MVLELCNFNFNYKNMLQSENYAAEFIGKFITKQTADLSGSGQVFHYF